MPKWLNIVIFATYIICSIVTFKGVVDIVSMIAAILCALTIMQKNPSHYRIIFIKRRCMDYLWYVYGAYTMLASHIFTVASALLGIIRLDVLKKEK